MPIKKSESEQQEYESRQAFRNWLLQTQWNVRDIHEPLGPRDFEIEIVEGGNVSNKVIWVQLKSVRKKKTPPISYSIETKYLKHYEKARLPMAIVLWVKPDDAFYCLFAQRYIREQLSKEDPDWREKETKTIVFGPESRLREPRQLSDIATRGYLYVAKQELESARTGGPSYWLDGIPQSDDSELRERTLKGLLYAKEEKHEAAIEELEEILRVCTPSPTQRMSILLSLGNACYSLSRFDEALTNYEAILRITQETTEKDALQGNASALGNIGLIYQAKGDLDRALQFLDNALKIHKQIGDREGEAADLGNIGIIYRHKGQLNRALKFHEDALKIGREIGYRQEEANQLGNIGLIHQQKGGLDTALKRLNEALNIQRKIGDRQGEASALGNIGLIYQDKGELDRALKFHKDAFKIDREIGYRQGEATDLGNIGIAYERKGDLKRALTYLKKALAILDACGLTYGRNIIERAIRRIEGA